MDKKTFIEKTGAEYISSRQNPRVMRYASFKDDKGRASEGQFLAEGIKLSREALTYADVRELLVSESYVEKCEYSEITATAREKNVKITVLADSVFEKISTEKAPQGVISVVAFMRELHVSGGFSKWAGCKRIIMLDEIRDPGNLGTIVRSAEALGVGGVVLAGCADIYNPKTVRASMGALFRMPVYVTDDAAGVVHEMRSLGRRVIGATLGENTVTLGEYETDPRDCIVIGNEGHGISDDVIKACDMCVKIPMAGECESLNASAAAVCIMWEYKRNEKR